MSHRMIAARFLFLVLDAATVPATRAQSNADVDHAMHAVELQMRALNTARDTDWMMRLVDVLPDGSTAFLVDGVLRARGRGPSNHRRLTAEKLNTLERGQRVSAARDPR